MNSAYPEDRKNGLYWMMKKHNRFVGYIRGWYQDMMSKLLFWLLNLQVRLYEWGLFSISHQKQANHSIKNIQVYAIPSSSWETIIWFIRGFRYYNSILVGKLTK